MIPFLQHLLDTAPVIDPPRPHAPIVVAGGAAVDFDKAHDVDIWLPSVVALERLMIEWFNVLGVTQPFFNVEQPEGYDHTLGTRLLTTHMLPAPYNEKPVQFLSYANDSVQDLFDSWDISTHMVGVDQQGRFYTGAKWTSLSKQPRITAYRKGQLQRTWDRYCKICRRYGWSLNVDDAEKLVGLLASDEDWDGPRNGEPGTMTFRGAAIDWNNIGRGMGVDVDLETTPRTTGRLTGITGEGLDDAVHHLRPILEDNIFQWRPTALRPLTLTDLAPRDRIVPARIPQDAIDALHNSVLDAARRTGVVNTAGTIGGIERATEVPHLHGAVDRAWERFMGIDTVTRTNE